MKKLLRLTIILALFLGLLVALAACGTPDGGGDAGDTPGGENGDTPGGEGEGGGENGDTPPAGDGGGTSGGGDTPGGDNPGGDNSGGDNPGGDNPGGDNPGGDEGGDVEDAYTEGLEFLLTDGYYTVTGYRGSSTSVVVPSVYEGLPVAAVAEGAFADILYITSVTLPHSVVMIGDGALGGCASLSAVTLPSSLLSVPARLFAGCVSLTSVTLPDTVSAIGDEAFSGCTRLARVALPSSLMTVGRDAFLGCASLAEVALPEGLVAVATGAFSGTGLVRVLLPSTLLSVADGAFSHCRSLTELVFSASVTVIGDGVLSYCPSLSTLRVSEENALYAVKDGCLVLLTTGAVKGGTRDASIPLDGSVTEISPRAFLGMPLLTVTLPEGLVTVGEGAFGDCASLRTISLPHTMSHIGEGAFSGCDALSIVHYASTRDAFAAIAVGKGNDPLLLATLYAKANEEGGGDGGDTPPPDDRDEWYERGLRFVLSDTLDSYILVSYVGEETVLSVPQRYRELPVSAIADGAFMGTGVTSVSLPSSVTSIGRHAFKDCASLITLSLPPLLTSLGDEALSGCVSLLEITLPATLGEVADFAFFGCASLARISGLDGCTRIGAMAFLGCVSLVEFSLPPLVETVGDGAFKGCTSLSSVAFGEWLTSIGSEAFSGCSALSSVTIPSGVVTVGDFAFAYCTRLSSITLSEGICHLGTMAFTATGCEALLLPSSLTSAGGSVFAQCPSLREVRFADGTAEIFPSMFYACPSLETVLLPSTLARVGRDAFYLCPVTEVEYDGYSSSFYFIVIEGGNDALLDAAIRFDGDGDTGIEWEYVAEEELGDGVWAHLYFNVNTYEYKVSVSGGGRIAEGIAIFEQLRDRVTCIEIFYDVTYLPDRLFAGYTAAYEILLPDELSLGEDVFADTAYARRGYTDGVLYIGAYLLDVSADAPSVLSVREGTRVIAKGAFRHAKTTVLTLPTTVTHATLALDGCDTIVTAAVPAHVRVMSSSLTELFVTGGSIGELYYEGSSVKRVVLGKDVYVGNGAFLNARELTTLVFEQGAGAIGMSAFSGCVSLTEIRIPASVGALDNGAFENCISLTRVTLDEGITFIGSYAFYGASLLTEMIFPRSLVSLGEGALGGCTSLKTLAIPFVGNDDDAHYVTALSFLFGGYSADDNARLVPSTLTHLTVHRGKIKAQALRDCASLTHVTLGEGVSLIGDEAFSGCTSLVSFFISFSVTEIGARAFFGCEGLSLFIPATVTTLSPDAFVGCPEPQYKTYKVTFVGFGGEILDVQTVRYGASATPPECYAPDGWIWSGVWSHSLVNISEDMTVTTTFEQIPEFVVRVVNDDTSAPLVGAEVICVSGDVREVHRTNENGEVVLKARDIPWTVTVLEVENFFEDDAAYTFRGTIRILIVRLHPKRDETQ